MPLSVLKSRQIVNFDFVINRGIRDSCPTTSWSTIRFPCKLQLSRHIAESQPFIGAESIVTNVAPQRQRITRFELALAGPAGLAKAEPAPQPNARALARASAPAPAQERIVIT